jgi:hypothetical protein
MARGPLRSLLEPSSTREDRVIDLGGQAGHVFQFDAPLKLVYDYFSDIQPILQFIPDVSEVSSYAKNHYRMIIGATDILGFAMAGVFDFRVEFEKDQCIRGYPATNGPAIRLKGFSFPGDLWIETLFSTEGNVTCVEYTIELAMTIPLPGPLRKMPRPLVREIGERALEFKISNIITGFSRHVEVDFARFAHWALDSGSFAWDQE